MTAIRIEDGHVDFKQRYVRTDRFLAEAEARRALFGRYRNLYTDDESVKGVIRPASNTNVVFWRGVLLALKEDGPPFALDPVTLETIGRYDFDDQMKSPTFTAHPKFDPVTGEMVCFGYDVGGNGNDASCDIVVYTIDADGRKTEECWYKSPFCGMIHDCGISENYLVLSLTPLKCSLDRLKKGGNHWAWDPDEDQWYGVIPRRNGKPEDILWFRSDNGPLAVPCLPSPSFKLLTVSSFPRPHSQLLRRAHNRPHNLRPHSRRRQRLLLLPTRNHTPLRRAQKEQTPKLHLPLDVRPKRPPRSSKFNSCPRSRLCKCRMEHRG